jgi:hypothetical protein
MRQTALLGRGGLATTAAALLLVLAELKSYEYCQREEIEIGRRRRDNNVHSSFVRRPSSLILIII